MKRIDKKDIIPEQHEGASTDIKKAEELESVEEAQSFYSIVKERLLNVNDWEKLAGKASANFTLTDSRGTDVNRSARTGDHFKIDIPGPGTVTGKGYDWVKIERIEEKASPELDSEITAITVRPATNPTNEKQDVAHFFTDEATSSFVVERKGNKVIAAVHGRNEKPNTKAEKGIDKTRNTLIALGAMAGISSAQWSNLVSGLLNRK